MATGNFPNHVFSVPAGLDCIQGSAEDACLGDAIAAPVVRIYVEPAVDNPLDRWESCDSLEANPTPGRPQICVVVNNSGNFQLRIVSAFFAAET